MKLQGDPHIELLSKLLDATSEPVIVDLLEKNPELLFPELYSKFISLSIKLAEHHGLEEKTDYLKGLLQPAISRNLLGEWLALPEPLQQEKQATEWLFFLVSRESLIYLYKLYQNKDNPLDPELMEVAWSTFRSKAIERLFSYQTKVEVLEWGNHAYLLLGDKRSLSLIDNAVVIESAIHAFTYSVCGDLFLRQNNIVEAITCFKKSLSFLTIDHNVDDWSRTTINLSLSYKDCPGDDRPGNIDVAIELLQSVISVFEPANCSERWAEAQLNLGLFYRERILGDKRLNMEAAISACEKALTVFTKEQYPYQWGSIQVNLGNVYRSRVEGTVADNLDLSISHCEKALIIFTLLDYPYRWSGVKNNMGNAYRERINGEQADNIEKAIDCFQESLSVIDPATQLRDWSMRQFNLGIAYLLRTHGVRSSNINSAITSLENSLKGRQRHSFPYEWAASKYRLGLAYKKAAAETNDDVELQKALAAFEDSLLIYRKEIVPVDWARSWLEIGNVCSKLQKGDKSQLAKKAMSAYKNALLIFTLESDPEKFLEAAKRLSVLEQVASLENATARPDRYLDFLTKVFSVFNDDAVIQLAEHNSELVVPELHQILLQWKDEKKEDNASLKRIEHVEELLLPHICRNAVIGLMEKSGRISDEEVAPLLYYFTDKSARNIWVQAGKEVNDSLGKNVAINKNLVTRLLLHKLFLQCEAPEILSWMNQGNYFLIDPSTLVLSPIHGTAIAKIEQAIVYHNWGILIYLNRERADELTCVETSIHCYERALEFFSQEDHAFNWAKTQMNMSEALNQLANITGQDRSEEAIAALSNAEKIYTKEFAFQEWGRCRFHLGIAHLQKANRSNDDGIEMAIQYLLDALDCFKDTGEDILEEIFNGLGIAYSRRQVGEKKNNEERAIAHFKNLLETSKASGNIYRVVTTLHKLSDLYMQTSTDNKVENYREALTLLEELALIYHRRGLLEEWAGTQFNMSAILNNLPDGNTQEYVEKAIEYALNALTFYTLENSPLNWARIQYNLGIAYSRKNVDKKKYKTQAIAAYQNALTIYGPMVDEELTVTSHINLLELYLTDADTDVHLLEDGIPFCEKQIASHEHAGDLGTNWATMQCRLATIYLHQSMRLKYGFSNVLKARKALETGIAYFDENSMQTERAAAQLNMGLLYMTLLQGNIAANQDKAIYYFEQSALVYGLQETTIDWALLQQNLAVVMMDRISGNRVENIEKSIGASYKALQIYTKDHYPFERGSTLLNLSAAYQVRQAGDIIENQEKSIELLMEALDFLSIETNPFSWSTIQNNLGNAYVDRIKGDRGENVALAIAAYEQSARVKKRHRMPLEWALCQNNLGNAYKTWEKGDRAENLEKAIEYFENALKEYTFENSPIETGRTNYNLGIAYGRRLKGNSAENIERSIGCFKKSFLIRSRERYPYEWALTMYAQGNILMLESMRSKNEGIAAAAECFQNALLVLTPEAFPMDCLPPASDLGFLHYISGNYKAAIDVFKIGHNALENLRGRAKSQANRLEISAKSNRIYALLVECYLKLGVPEQAFSFICAAKARTLSDTLGSQQPEMSQRLSGNPGLIAEWNEIRRLWNEIELIRAELQNSVQKVQGEIDVQQVYEHQLLKQLQKLQQTRLKKLEIFLQRAPLISYIDNIAPLGHKEAQQLAKNLNTTIVEYFHAFGGWVAFVVSANEIYHFRLPADTGSSIDECYRWISLFKTGLQANQGTIRQSKILQRLYASLVQPIRHLLSVDSSLLIAPSENLHNIPIGLAMNEKGQYLFELFELTFTASSSVANITYKQFEKEHQALTNVFENGLVVGHSGFEPYKLEYTADETKAVAALFENHILFREEQATPEKVITAVKGQSFQVLHFACHGGFNFNEPQYSGLMLNGQLTIEKVINELRIMERPLVVISACETGRSLVESGDEVTSFNSAFLQAGAGTVISSLWPVNDKSTMRLFESFYRFRKLRNKDNCQALRLAMKQTASTLECKHAFYWGAFQVYGLPILSNTK